MQNRATYKIQNGDNEPFVFTVKPGSRIHESLEALRRGPLPAPAYTRRSDHILHLRRAGLLIETEIRRQAEDSEYKYGVYHLVSVVLPVSKVSSIEAGAVHD